MEFVLGGWNFESAIMVKAIASLLYYCCNLGKWNHPAWIHGKPG
jgi:hypothetical protein